MAAIVVGRKMDFGLAASLWKWFDTGLAWQWRETTGILTWKGGRAGKLAGVALEAFVWLLMARETETTKKMEEIRPVSEKFDIW